MSVKETVQQDNKIIRNVSVEVENPLSEEVKKIVKDLIDTMRHEDLVGIAAPQIGHNVRVFVTEIRKTKYRDKDFDELRVFINPKIISKSEKTKTGHEGCGSYYATGKFGPVDRAVKVSVVAQNEKGEEFRLEAEDFLARVIQHETDHLDGILFADHVKRREDFLDREEYLKLRN